MGHHHVDLVGHRRCRGTLGVYIVIGLVSTFSTYWFSDKLAIASMGARAVTEQEAPALYRIVRELSAKAGKPMPRIYVAPTMSPNAFATGRNERHAAVCCTQGILNILNEREIRGVLGHELMHVYNHDILTSAIASALATIITYLGYSLMYFGGGRSNDRDNSSGAFGLIGVLLSAILVPIGASLIQMAISRTREFDADEDGSRLTGDPEALASALNKISYGAQTNPMPKTAGTQSVSSMMIANPFSARGFSSCSPRTHLPTSASAGSCRCRRRCAIPASAAAAARSTCTSFVAQGSRASPSCDTLTTCAQSTADVVHR